MQSSALLLMLGLVVLPRALGQPGPPPQDSNPPGSSQIGGRGGRVGQGRRPLQQIPPKRQRAPILDLVRYLSVLKNRFENTIDPNSDGVATFEEVQVFLQKYKPGVTNQTVLAFINRRDLNGNGVVDFVPDFIYDIMKPDSAAQAAREWFALEDTNGDGFVTRQELVTVAQNIGFPPKEAEAAVDSYYTPQDKNKDGKLSFDEYKNLYIARQKK